MTHPSDRVLINDPLRDIRSALQAWSDEATGQLRDDSWIGIYDSMTWVKAGTNTWAPAPRLVWLLSPETSTRLHELPSLMALEEAISHSAVLEPMIGGLIGTGGRAGLFHLRSLTSAFLPSRNDHIEGRAFSFEKRYHEISTLLAIREVEHQTTCPIQGVIFQQVPIDLAPGLSIEKMTDNEIATALGTGLVQGISGVQSKVSLDDGSLFALKKRFNLPLVIMPQGQERIATDNVTEGFLLGTHLADEVARLQQCLALVTHGRISMAGSMTTAAHPAALVSGDGIRTQLFSGPRGLLTPGVIFDRSSCQDVQRIWAALHDGGLSTNKAVALALRRLTFGTQRTNVEDRLLDVFIAAEALYLSDAGDARERGDLRFRLALRAAKWSEGTLSGWTQHDVFKLMKTGYDARSAVAHGGTPKPKDIIIKSSRASLAELVTATENVLRAGLHKAIEQIATDGGRLEVAWDDLLFD